MAISKEVKTAGLVITGLLLIIFLFNYLKGENLLDSSRKYYAVFDNVKGLALSSPVTINGLTVGKVQEINFENDGKGSLKVELLVENDYEFSENSIAQLYENGLIGGMAIAILPAYDEALNAKSGKTLKSEVRPGLTDMLNDKLTPLQEKLESMLTSADSVLISVNNVFDDKTKKNLQLSIAQLNATLTAFKNTSNSVNQLLEDNQEKLNTTLTNVSEISENLNQITDSLANANLAQTVRNLEATIGNFNAVLTDMQNGEGTMGKLLKDEALYNNISGATKELEELLRDIKLHPKRYFRILSKKEIPYEND